MYCYQCDQEVLWLAPDGRCACCTRCTPEELLGVHNYEEYEENLYEDYEES